MRGLLIACLFFLSTAAHAQSGIVDSIAQKIYWHARGNPGSTLFVHFDKNIYTNKEIAWFTGYLLKEQTRERAFVLSVMLMRNDDRAVLAQGKFVMNDGLSQGNLFIPDSLPTGDYSFVCYTNAFANDAPTDVFIQPVTIKTVNFDSFTARLGLLDNAADSIRIRLSAANKNGTPIANAPVKYYVGNRSSPFKTDTLRTGKDGTTIVSIPAKLITGNNNLFQAEISNRREIQTFSMKLPVHRKTAIVKFYPEGGQLVEWTKSNVGIEVTGNDGTPLAVTAELYQDNMPVSTISTDASGLGRFSITPAQGAVYSVRLKNPVYAKDSVYTLPKPLAEGPVITIEKALAGDTLEVILDDSRLGMQWTGIIHDYRKIVSDVAVTGTGSRVRIKVPLTDVPKGLFSFTLFDSLQRPCAERIFFAHYNRQPMLGINCNASKYTTREKVEVSLHVFDDNGAPAKGLVSIACVRDNRFDERKMTDIASYRYLTHELESASLKNLSATSRKEKEQLENLLLVKGWRRYRWEDIAVAKPSDTLYKLTNLSLTGRVYLPGKRVKHPPMLTLMNVKEKAALYVMADTGGRFAIAQERLMLEPGHFFTLFVKGIDQFRYRVEVTDQYKEWNKKLAPKLSVLSYAPQLSEQTSEATLVDRKERVIQLADVEVTASRNKGYYGNACGDYVCPNRILNCPRHGYGIDPTVGEVYRTERGEQVYVGCEGINYLSSVEGIMTPKEFYIPDFSLEGGEPQEELTTTLYWNPTLITGNNGEAHFSFSTNDLTGKFRIVVQGITDAAGAVYGEKFFEVE